LGAWSAGTTAVIAPGMPRSASAWPSALIPLQRSGSGTETPLIAIGLGLGTLAAAVSIGVMVKERRHEAAQDEAERDEHVADLKRRQCPPDSPEGQQ
jgi:hypothetical protein